MPARQVGLDQVIIDRWEHLADALEEASASDLMQVMIQLLSHIADLHRRAERAMQYPSSIRRACDFLSRDLQSKVSMPVVARKVGMGYSAFRKKFEEVVGMSPGALRIRARIEHARELLVNTEEPLGAIAERLGYFDQYAFSAQFKRFMGIPPSRMRKLNRA